MSINKENPIWWKHFSTHSKDPIGGYTFFVFKKEGYARYVTNSFLRQFCIFSIPRVSSFISGSPPGQFSSPRGQVIIRKGGFASRFWFTNRIDSGSASERVNASQWGASAMQRAKRRTPPPAADLHLFPRPPVMRGTEPFLFSGRGAARYVRAGDDVMDASIMASLEC